MQSQNHQELRISQAKGNDKSNHHKKIKNTEILLKYKSFFHQKNITKKEFNYLNRQNYISSLDLKELPKTLQAYYSVFGNSKNTSSSSSSLTVTQSPISTSMKSTGNQLEDFSLSDKHNTRSKRSCKNELYQKVLQSNNLKTQES